jgi:hypothetical protein
MWMLPFKLSIANDMFTFNVLTYNRWKYKYVWVKIITCASIVYTKMDLSQEIFVVKS